MPYDEALARRIRDKLARTPGLNEKKMFGGVGFMLYGNLACGVNGNDLIVRVGPEKHAASLAQPYTRPFDMTGRPMAGWVVVEPPGFAVEADLDRWIAMGIDFAATLPPK